MSIDMNWYLAKIVYQVIIGDGKHKPQFDEQFRLILADEHDWAVEKAQTMGRLGECTYQNHNQEAIKWKYIAVEDLFPIEYIEDGAQLYSQTEEPIDEQEYIQIALERAQRLPLKKPHYSWT